MCFIDEMAKFGQPLASLMSIVFIFALFLVKINPPQTKYYSHAFPGTWPLTVG